MNDSQDIMKVRLVSQRNGSCLAAISVAVSPAFFPLFHSFVASCMSMKQYKCEECKVVANVFTEERIKEVIFMGVLKTSGILWSKARLHG